MKLTSSNSITDWHSKQIGEVTLKVGSGITPKGGERVYKTTGRPFIRSQNIGWGNLQLDDVAFIDESLHQTFDSTEIQRGDVLLNITGASIGRSAIATAEIEGGNVNQHVCIIRTEQSKLNPSLVNYLLLSEQGQRQIESFQAGGNRQGLNFGQIKSIKFLIPKTIQEQTSIVTVLSDTDALISSLEKLIAKKHNIKQGAMQELLKPKKGWVIKTYGDVFYFLLTASYSRAELSINGEIQYVHYGDIHTKWNDFLDLSESVLPTISHSQLNGYPLVKEGDIIMADASEDYEGIGKSVEIKKMNSCRVISGLHTFLLRDKSGVFVDGFKGYIHLSPFVKKQLDRLATGLKVYGISKTNLKMVQIPIPNKEEQIRIANILNDMGDEIRCLESKLSKYRQIKSGMMQNLLTGKIRLV